MPKALITVDLGYGDAGKGSIVDYLVRDFNAHGVVRFNGGAQAAHNVVLPDGRFHTFSQFGSGTFVPGVRTFLSKYMLVNPIQLLNEDAALEKLGITDAFDRLTIDGEAVITTPWHIAANRVREIIRGKGRHGSCGMGIGETAADVAAGIELRVKNLTEPSLASMLATIRRHKQEQMRPLIDAHPELRDELEDEVYTLFSNDQMVNTLAVYDHLPSLCNIAPDWYPLNTDTWVFEAAQGILLDEWHGFFPYVTRSTCTSRNAHALCDAWGIEEKDRHTIGIARAYMTRHGAGPFVTELPLLGKQIPDYHNGTNRWQEGWRVGYTDFMALDYAIRCDGRIDSLAITNLDRLDQQYTWATCDAYRWTGPGSGGSVVGTRMTHLDVTERDLAEQERLTNVLLECEPEYSEFIYEEGELIRRFMTNLKKPISLLSRGPTHLDKRTFGFRISL